MGVIDARKLDSVVIPEPYKRAIKVLLAPDPQNAKKRF